MQAVSEKKTKKYEIEMCKGPLMKSLLLFAVPLMLSSILQLLFNAADIVVVGRFAGDHALAAVGSTTSLINLMVNLFMGISIGVNVMVAHFYGAKDNNKLSDAVHTAIALSIISGILVTVIGVCFSRLFLIWMQTPKEVLGLSTIYLRIYFLGMVGNMVYNFGSAILRGVGDTKRPLYYLTFAGIVNVLLNLLFVIKFKMGVAGVGLATSISEFISAFLVIRCLVHEDGPYKVVLSKIKMDMNMVKRILKIGIPAGIQGTIFAISNVVIQSSVNTFGATIMAGNAAASNIEGFVYMAMNAFYQAALSFTGQNMGAANYKRVHKILLTSELLVALTGLILGNFCVIFGKTLLGIYTSSPLVIDAGMYRLRVIARTYLLCGVMDVFVGVLRGMGYSIMPMIVSMVGACFLRLLLIATLFQIPALHTITVLYMLYPITWIITALTHLCCYMWARKKL